jgi:hypothetical protein
VSKQSGSLDGSTGQHGQERHGAKRACLERLKN